MKDILLPFISVSHSQTIALTVDANLEKKYRVSGKGDNVGYGGYSHLRSIGPSLLVYALATQDAIEGLVIPSLGALPQHFSTIAFGTPTPSQQEVPQQFLHLLYLISKVLNGFLLVSQLFWLNNKSYKKNLPTNSLVNTYTLQTRILIRHFSLLSGLEILVNK
jgi:hypothetical protein